MLNIAGVGRRVRVYVGESTQWEHRPLYRAILEFLRREGAAGASVLRGIAGFGATSRIHTAVILRLSEDLPIVIEWVDAPDRVERLLPRLCEMVTEGLVTVEDVQVVKYRHRPVRTDLPEQLRVADVMSSSIVSVRPDTPVDELVRLLVAGGYRAAPVIDANEQVVGLVTNSDLVERGGLALRLDLLVSMSPETFERELATLAASGKTAADLMTSPAVTIRADATVLSAARLMAERRLKRLPVVDAAGRLLGMVSRVDLLRTVAEGYPLPEEPPAPTRRPRLVGEIMRTRVPTVPPQATLAEVLDAVVSTRLNRAVVVDEQRRVVGIITDAELVRRLGERPGVIAALMRRTAAVPTTDDVRARDLMIRDVVTTQPEVPIEVAIRQMLTQQRKILPVVDPAGRLLGVVDRYDLLRALAGQS
jgi:CBS domain-containing protein